jgi:dihydrofolate synthase/folylpolyglutamate synthase
VTTAATPREALAWLDSLESLGIQPGLDRITALLARLDDPQRGLPAVIVAGTNGKGSTVAFLAAVLEAAGLEAGIYTSPHLIRFNERIRVGAAMIPDADLAALADDVRGAIEQMRRDGLPSPTYFEATTALAFLHFRRRGVPLAVLEVGMGGRYDATNVAEPLATAITPIALDHTQWLGHTVAEIAWQKAGVVRSGVPLVVSRQEPAARRVILDEAARHNAPVTETTSCSFEPAHGFPDPPSFELATPSGGLYRAHLALRGDHQADNAAAAVLLAEILRERRIVRFDPGAVARGLSNARWPGRLELVPDPSGADLLLDGAHNPAGCAILADYVRTHQPRRPRRVLLFAAMRDKEAGTMLEALRPIADEAVFTGLPVPRGTPPSELLPWAQRLDLPAAIEPDPHAGLRSAAGRAGPGGLVIACGSLYLVGALLPGTLDPARST